MQIQDRPVGGLNEEKKRYAHVHEPIAKLPDIVKALKPSFLIGRLIIQHVFFSSTGFI